VPPLAATWIREDHQVAMEGMMPLVLKITGHTCYARSTKITEKNTRFREIYTCFECEIKTRVVHILVIFQHGPMFSHINGKLSPRPFE